MSKQIIFFFFLSLLFILLKCDDQNSTMTNDDDEDKFEIDKASVEIFEEALKEYLKEMLYYNNNSIEVTKEEMDDVFTDVLSEGDDISLPAVERKVFQKVKEEFLNEIFDKKNRTEIKGSEVYGWFNLHNIMKLNNRIQKQMNPNGDKGSNYKSKYDNYYNNDDDDDLSDIPSDFKIDDDDDDDDL